MVAWHGMRGFRPEVPHPFPRGDWYYPTVAETDTLPAVVEVHLPKTTSPVGEDADGWVQLRVPDPGAYDLTRETGMFRGSPIGLGHWHGRTGPSFTAAVRSQSDFDCEFYARIELSSGVTGKAGIVAYAGPGHQFTVAQEQTA